jgi:uncharacterized membrane protein YdjX (TVP38/TMEM64 family)
LLVDLVRSRRLVGLLAAVLLAGLGAATACGAPASQAVEGPVADEVRAALDSGRASFEHARWDSLLAAGVRGGLVDYPYFQRHRATLDAYLERVAGADLASLASEHLKALLINAYNAYTVKTILENPRVASIRDIDGVWTGTTHTVGGHELTLDQIEHNVLRPFFRDPRIHFVVNCASLSCAPLPPWAFGGDSLEAELEERTRTFLRDSANVRVEDGTLMLSRYFDWYGDDFTGEAWTPRAETIPLFVARYARTDVAELVAAGDGEPPVRFLPYDWSLNDAVPPDPSLAGAAVAPDTAPARPASGDADTGRGTDPAGRPTDEDPAAGDAGPPSGEGWVATLRREVRAFGPAAPLAYGAAYVVATVLFVPGAPLTIGAGVAFGLLWGTVLVSVASTVGAALAFLVGRYLLRKKVEGWVADRPRFRLVDRAVGEQGWKIVALTRLSPVFPFNLLNYAYGLTRVGFGGYVAASWAAMLPGTLLYVYLGVAGAEVAEAATGTADWGRTALQALGVLATLGVVVLAGRIATRALREAADGAGVGDGASGAGGSGTGGDGADRAGSGGEGAGDPVERAGPYGS